MFQFMTNHILFVFFLFQQPTTALPTPKVKIFSDPFLLSVCPKSILLIFLYLSADALSH